MLIGPIISDVAFSSCAFSEGTLILKEFFLYFLCIHLLYAFTLI